MTNLHRQLSKLQGQNRQVRCVTGQTRDPLQYYTEVISVIILLVAIATTSPRQPSSRTANFRTRAGILELVEYSIQTISA